MKINHKECPIKSRRKKYPEAGEQFDPIYKYFKFLRDRGDPMPQETADWVDGITQIKSTFPKE